MHRRLGSLRSPVALGAVLSLFGCCHQGQCTQEQSPATQQTQPLTGPRAPVVGANPLMPLVQYTDLLSAPRGAFVTLWGRGFGTAQGTSQLLLGGRPVERILSWTEGEIEFQLPRDAEPGDLVVRTAMGESPRRWLRIHEGNIYFVSPSGNDDWSGKRETPGDGDGPFRTLGRVPRALRAGDVVYVRSGQYTSGMQFDSVWAFYDAPESGTQDKPIAIVAYPGEEAVIGDNRFPRTFSFYRGDDVTFDYITIAKFKIRPQCTALELRGMHNGRAVGNEIFGQSPDPNRGCGDGTIALQASNGWKILGNYIHDNGYHKMDHAIYLAGFGTNQHTEIAFNRVREQHGGRAIQFYGHMPSDNIEDVSIHDNELEDIDRDGILLGGSDGGAMGIHRVRIYNNLIVRAGRCDGGGVRLNNTSADGVRIHHNTFVDNGLGDRACFDSPGTPQGHIVIDLAARVDIMNNIFSARSARFFQIEERPEALRVTRNLYAGSGGSTSEDQDALSGDPLFIDPAQGDYRLRSGSPAIDSANQTGLTTDHDGVERPRGRASDLGAYEFVPGFEAQRHARRN